MFSYIDVTKYICYYLEGRDILYLSKSCWDAWKFMGPLFAGAVINGQERRGNMLANIITIPLLDIDEWYPLTIITVRGTYPITRLCKIKKLNAETLRAIIGCTLKYYYIVNDCVKYCVSVSIIRDMFEVSTSLEPLSVYGLSFMIGLEHTVMPRNDKLKNAIEFYCGGDLLAQNTIRKLGSEDMLKFIISFDG